MSLHCGAAEPGPSRGAHRKRGSLAVALLLAFAMPRTPAAQVGATTDIIIGTVTGPDGQPLAGAVVQATSLETQWSRQRTTDARGRFTIVFPEGGGQYELTVRYVGMAPVRVTIVRQADEDRLVANVRMELTVVTLEPVAVQAAAQSRGLERLGPGATGRDLRSEAMSRLPITASDLTALATLAPGVVGMAETDSTRPSFSVAGQRPTANRATLDGLSYSGAMVPLDAIRTTRVVTNTYDVARGQFSGGLVASTTRSGTNVPQGAFTYSGRDRALAWGGVTASPFSQGYTQNQIGGGMGGPVVRDRLFAFAALQGRWKDQALPSLLTADPATLERLGVSSDSAARFLALAGAAGVPLRVPDARHDRGTNNAAALLRMDWNLAEAHTLMLRLDGRWNSDDPVRVRPLAFPSTGGRRSEQAGGLMASLTSHFGEQFINEVRGYISAVHTDAGGFLALPEARVHVTSDLPDSIRGIATLTFGGNHAFPQHVDNTMAEVREEVSWMTQDAAHRIKLGGFLNAARLRANQTPNQFGTFVFHSLDAFAAGRPSSFTRTLAPLDHAGTSWNEALYLGDTWRASARLQLTYGARLEAAQFRGAPTYNRTLDSLFGVRTDRIPRELHVSPRIGFTWTLATESEGAGQALPRRILRGGVGDFRSLPATPLYSAALSAPGLATAETQLQCIGSAVPTPAWAQYAQDPAAIPSQCVDTASAMTISPRPNATVFDPGYAAPRAWRASLGLQQQLLGLYTLTLDASYARGVHQYGFRDLNLVAAPRFTLPDESGRPVYVPADSIVPTTGALTSLASRVSPQFSQVITIGSDLRSDTRQFTVGLSRLPPRGTTLQLSYTFTRARDQSSFSCCAVSQGFAAPTTAGNPNVREWATSDFERRHSLLATVTAPVTAALEVTAIGRLTSGVPFTPLVGSDINGDGARNDRAFVFDPATASDPSVATAMRELLATAPPSVRDCLGRQLGHVAGRNSCTGPWQPALDFQINWRPASVGPARRLTVSLLTVNLLGGLDQWLHGAANLHGWGFTGAPDPFLLYIRSFDPVAQRFSYNVNGRFGATAGANGGVTVPFQLAIQAHLIIGTIPPSRRVHALLGEPSGGVPKDFAARLAQLFPNPIPAILGYRDSLRLTADQAARLQAISDSLDATTRNVSDSVQAESRRAGERADPTALYDRLRVKLAEGRRHIRHALEAARGVLTRDQWARLPDAVKTPVPR